jgi:hypothetical protein
MILVDSSVLIDVIEAKPDWRDWSAAQLTLHAQQQGLAINAIIYAEISRSFPSAEVQNTFLKEAAIKVLPIPNEAAFQAARAHMAYRSSGGLHSSTLPDFFIGAHAMVEQYQLLTRDPVRVRSYFPQVSLITTS